MPKGIVLELSDQEAVVLTGDGLFKRIKRTPGISVGDEVDVATQEKKYRGFTKWVAIAACLLLSVSVWSYWNVTQQKQVFAYVSVDINPSIEFGINKAGSVVSVKGLNQDGKEILGSLDVQGESIQQAIAEITRAALAKGFIRSNSEVVITTTPVAGAHGESISAQDLVHKDLSSIEQSAVQSAQKTLDAVSPSIHVDGLQISSEFREAASRNGLSPGKYAFYLKAQKQGYPVSVEDLQKYSISEVEKRNGIPDNFLHGVTEQSLGIALNSAEKADSQQASAPDGSSGDQPADPSSAAGATTDKTLQGVSPRTGDNRPERSKSEGRGDRAKKEDKADKADKGEKTAEAAAAEHPQESDGDAEHFGWVEKIRHKLHVKKQDKDYVDQSRNEQDRDQSGNHVSSRVYTGSGVK